MPASAILTAAGESTRMGRPKALLPWGHQTLVEHQVLCLLQAGATEVIVVLGHAAEQVAPLVARAGVRPVENARYRDGRATSIAAGARAVSPNADAIVVLGVDQPRTSELVAGVLRHHLNADALITSPRCLGRGGHPIVLSTRLRAELERVSENRQGLRELFARHRAQVNEVQMDDPMVLLDINTPEEYEGARRRYGM